MSSQISPRKNLPFYKRPMPLLSTVAVLVFAGWFVFGKNGLWDTYQVHQKQDKNSERIALINDQIKFLEKQLDDLRKKEPLALEAAARNYGLVAPDEKIYTIQVVPEEPKP